MKSKDEIIALFVQKKILSNKTNLVRRPFNWKTKFDLEAQQIFSEFAQNYRSEAEAWFCLCRKIELPICPVCNKKKVVFTGSTKNGAVGYLTTCEDCSANQVPAKIAKTKDTCNKRTPEQRAQIFEKRKNTNKKQHGDEKYMLFGSKFFKDALEDKYNDRNYNNSTQISATMLDKYGVAYAFLTPEAQQKSKEAAWSLETRQKRIENSIDKFGVSCSWKLPEIQEKNQYIKKENIHNIEQRYNCTMLGDVVKQYGQGFKRLGLEYLRIGSHVYVNNSDIPLIETYANEGTHTNGYVSKLEKDVLEYVKTIYTGKIEENCTTVVPNENHRFFELDIYLPEIKLAIDINGIYWHSTKFKDINYHQRKTRCCRKVGINIIHIFEDQWNTNKEYYQHIITECINGTFNNVISMNVDGSLIGDNSLPIFGNYEILNITAPQKHKVLTNEYYDCGEINYKILK